MIGLILKILTFPLRLIFGGRKSSPFGGMLKLVLILVVVAVLLKSCTGIRSTSSKQLNVNRGEVQRNTSLVVVTPPDIGRPRYHTSEQNVAPLKISTQYIVISHLLRFLFITSTSKRISRSGIKISIM